MGYSEGVDVLPSLGPRKVLLKVFVTGAVLGPGIYDIRNAQERQGKRESK